MLAVVADWATIVAAAVVLLAGCVLLVRWAGAWRRRRRFLAGLRGWQAGHDALARSFRANRLATGHEAEKAKEDT